MFVDEVEQLRNVTRMCTARSSASLMPDSTSQRGEAFGGDRSGRFVVKAYSAYSPKMFAGISEIDDVLQDRTVRIPLLRKKDDETVQRYKERVKLLSFNGAFGMIYMCSGLPMPKHCGVLSQRWIGRH